MFRALPIIALCAPAAAMDFDLTCEGIEPDWKLSTKDDTAQFRYLRDSDMTLMLTTFAQGRDWPIALTYVGRGDSAILMIEPDACDAGDLRATILTQRGDTPVLLLGCCTREDR